MGSAGRTSYKRPSPQLLHSKGQLQTRARTARQCFATTVTTALPGTGMFSEMIIPTASSVTRMCLPTTATSAERSSGSTQKTFRTRRSIGTRPVSFATSVEPVLWTSRIYCGPCYDAQFATRCDGCGDVFKAGMKKMEYKTRQWHEKCFVCCTCKNPIGTKSFIPKEHDIYCAGCYEDKFATKCIKCNKVITAGGVTYRNDPWHRECFTCTNCTKSLAGQRFTSREAKPYCAECFGELFSKRCTACSKPITGKGGFGNTKFIAFEKLAWHYECFICACCNESMVGKGFIQDEGAIICPECARKKMLEEMEEENEEESRVQTQVRVTN